MPTVRRGATFKTSWPANRLGSYSIFASGFAISAGTLKRRLRKSAKPGRQGAAAAQHDARDRARLTGGAQVGLRPLERHRETLAGVLDHRHHLETGARFAAHHRRGLGLARG